MLLSSKAVRTLPKFGLSFAVVDLCFQLRLYGILQISELSWIAENFVHSNFEYFQGWRCHSPTGQPVPVFSCPHCVVFSLVLIPDPLILALNLLGVACECCSSSFCCTLPRVWICLLYNNTLGSVRQQVDPSLAFLLHAEQTLLHDTPVCNSPAS